MPIKKNNFPVTRAFQLLENKLDSPHFKKYNESVYFLSFQGLMVYVGSSNHSIAQIKALSFSKKIKFDSYIFASLEESEHEECKAFFIRKFKPIYNRKEYIQIVKTEVQKEIFIPQCSAKLEKLTINN